MRKNLPIGNDSFADIRQNGDYYVDKTMMIRDFIRFRDKVALITRPRRFGKTLNMTMLREFFDITKDSRAIFAGLKIMDTELAAEINKWPVVHFSFKNCIGNTAEDLRLSLIEELFREYYKASFYLRLADAKMPIHLEMFLRDFEKLKSRTAQFNEIKFYISRLLQIISEHFGKLPYLFIDEYDQPIMSCYENGYFGDMKDFFGVFYGSALKGNDCLKQALLTGIQRVAKESIFSQINNVKVYNCLRPNYAEYFGLNAAETEELLSDYGLRLDDEVKARYNGYLFGGVEVYNPWSIINYADTGELEDFWINTSTNSFLREAIRNADDDFRYDYHQLIAHGSAKVGITLETSFVELGDDFSLWGLLVNAGYIAIAARTVDQSFMVVRIPNGEVKREFQKIVAQEGKMKPASLVQMFSYLTSGDISSFMRIYRSLVLSCTSYFDAKENAYHMLFLGMCISLDRIYKVTSNLESGEGRHDIRLESLSPKRPHIVIEFKQGEDIEQLKKDAIEQIIGKQYYAGLKGRVLCLGIAHCGKRCEIECREMTGA